MQYKYTIIMNNGNRYNILSKLKINELLNNIYGEYGKTVSAYYLDKRRYGYNTIVIYSNNISEILYDREVVDEEI